VAVLEAALSYAARGWSVFPALRNDKRPAIHWREYQHRRPSEREILEMFGDGADANIAVVTGHVSHLVVLDCDAPDALNRLSKHVPLTPLAETARGQHYYFKCPDRYALTITALAPDLDVRGESAYVVAPPSTHPSGKQYAWVVPPGEVDLAPVPDWLLEEISKRRVKPPRTASDIVRGVQEGVRNDSATCIAGKLLGVLPADDWDGIGWPLMCGWNLLNRPPLPERELRTVFESIATREATKRCRIEACSDQTIARILRAAICEIGLRRLAALSGVPRSTLSDFSKRLAPSPNTSTSLNTNNTKTRRPPTPKYLVGRTAEERKIASEADLGARSVRNEAVHDGI
jgi:hypothetical protein